VIAASTRRLDGCSTVTRLVPSGSRACPNQSKRGRRGELAGVSRFEAVRSAAPTPLVGREEEIDLLLRHWHQAQLAEGRVVLLAGEPGIGKSRIAESVLGKLEGEPHVRMRWSRQRIRTSPAARGA
jgi:predicted ATP-dependent serine protease